MVALDARRVELLERMGEAEHARALQEKMAGHVPGLGDDAFFERLFHFGRYLVLRGRELTPTERRKLFHSAFEPGDRFQAKEWLELYIEDAYRDLVRSL